MNRPIAAVNIPLLTRKNRVFEGIAIQILYFPYTVRFTFSTKEDVKIINSLSHCIPNWYAIWGDYVSNKSYPQST